VAAQNLIFEEYYQSDLKAHPERATAYGDYRYNDRLDEYSLAAIKSEHAYTRVSSGVWKPFRRPGFSEQDTLFP